MQHGKSKRRKLTAAERAREEIRRKQLGFYWAYFDFRERLKQRRIKRTDPNQLSLFS
jgi:hypothetical protein